MISMWIQALIENPVLLRTDWFQSPPAASSVVFGKLISEPAFVSVAGHVAVNQSTPDEEIYVGAKNRSFQGPRDVYDGWFGPFQHFAWRHYVPQVLSIRKPWVIRYGFQYGCGDLDPIYPSGAPAVVFENPEKSYFVGEIAAFCDVHSANGATLNKHSWLFGAFCRAGGANGGLSVSVSSDPHEKCCASQDTGENHHPPIGGVTQGQFFAIWGGFLGLEGLGIWLRARDRRWLGWGVIGLSMVGLISWIGWIGLDNWNGH